MKNEIQQAVVLQQCQQIKRNDAQFLRAIAALREQGHKPLLVVIFFRTLNLLCVYMTTCSLHSQVL